MNTLFQAEYYIARPCDFNENSVRDNIHNICVIK